MSYLTNHFEDLGEFSYGVNGPEVLKYQEIEAYCNLTGVSLTPAEVAILRRMSKEYVSKYYSGEDPGAPAPYVPETSEVDQEGLSSKILSVFRRRAAGNKNK